MKKMSINNKLKWSFIFVLAYVIIIGFLGIFTSGFINNRYKKQVNDSINNLESSYVLLKDVLELKAHNNTLFVNASNKDIFDNIILGINNSIEHFDNSIEKYISNSESKDANSIDDIVLKLKAEDNIKDEQLLNLEKINNDFIIYKEHYEVLQSISMVNDNYQLRVLIEQDLNPKLMELEKKLNNDSMLIGKTYLHLVENTSMFVNGITIFNLIIIVLSSIVAMALKNYLSKHIGGNITELLKITNSLVDGDLDGKIIIDSYDEIGLLENNIQKVMGVIKDLYNDIDNISNRINIEGELGAKIDSTNYKGAYKKIAVNINRLSEKFEDDYMYVIDCIEDFGNGSFDEDIKNFPGKKRILTDGLENIQNKFININNQINNIIENIKNGELDFVIDDSSFDGSWKELIIGFNDVVVNLGKPISMAIDAVENIAMGNLDFQIEGEYKGEFLRLKNSLNLTINELSEYINDISYILNEIGNKNLDIEVTVNYKGNFSNIKDSLNKIIKNLNIIIEEINVSADQVALGARNIADSSIQIADSSTEQAHIVEELLNSVSLISTETVNNAEYAESARQMAGHAQEKASIGSTEMGQMLNAMGEINVASNNIQKIIKVIDDIAFQTNLLALNAAVEAARAGTHGKGFAVVAEEVRNLAARSTNAARETTNLINGSLRKVVEGQEIANKTAETLDEIVTNVKDITELVTQVATSSNEQSNSISEMNNAISKISEVAQINTATSQEEAAASEQLSNQSDIFKNMVSDFKIKKYMNKDFYTKKKEEEKRKSDLKDKRKDSENYKTDKNNKKANVKREVKEEVKSNKPQESIFKELSELSKMDCYNNNIANNDLKIDFERNDVGKY